MSSYEDRLRAVQLYIKLGKRVGLTIRHLGYPTKNALKTWYRECEQSQDLRAGYMRTAKFSQGDKQRAVEHYLEHGRYIAVTVKALGYPCRSLLHAWLQERYPQPTRVVGRTRIRSGSPTSRSSKFRPARYISSPMIDCFDGMVVSWSIGTRPNAELVNTMLDAATEKVAASGERPVLHSDRGGHYRWPGWLTRISDAKLVRSMSRKGCSPDNEACEGFFGRLKTEMFFDRNWLSTSIEEFIAALDAYIRWYSEVRIKSSLSFRSPAQHRRQLAIAA